MQAPACQLCGETSHIAKACPLLLRLQQQQPVCQVCDQTGHAASDCPLVKQARGDALQSQGPPSGGYPSGGYPSGGFPSGGPPSSGSYPPQPLSQGYPPQPIPPYGGYPQQPLSQGYLPQPAPPYGGYPQQGYPPQPQSVQGQSLYQQQSSMQRAVPQQKTIQTTVQVVTFVAQQSASGSELWRIVSHGRKLLTAMPDGGLALRKDKDPEGGDEWEITKTQRGGKIWVSFMSHTMQQGLCAQRGYGGVYLSKSVGPDSEEAQWTVTLEKTEAKKNSGTAPVFSIKSHHDHHYLREDGSKVKGDGKKMAKAEEWSIVRVTDSASQRKAAQLYSQVFHRQSADGALRLDHGVLFSLKEKIFSAGGAVITGPDKRDWFRIGRLNQVFEERINRARFGLMNMKGEPLIFLQELRDIQGLKYSLHRAIQLNTTYQSQSVATIERVVVFMKPTYNCILADGTMLNLTGSIGDAHTEFKDDAHHTGVCCTIHRHMSVTSGHYTIRIEPGVDVLLFLAFAVAIDKMHHEAHTGEGGSVTGERGGGLFSTLVGAASTSGDVCVCDNFKCTCIHWQ